MKNISKTKGTHGNLFASYCLERVDNKGQRAIKTKEYERQKRKEKRREKMNTKRYISRNKRRGRGYNGNRCTKQKRAWEKAWNYFVNRRNRGGKQNKVAGEGLELVRGTKDSQSECRGHRQQNKQKCS